MRVRRLCGCAWFAEMGLGCFSQLHSFNTRNIMAKTLPLAMCLLAGAAAGFQVARSLPVHPGMVQIQNFDARSTMPAWVYTARIASTGYIYSPGSEELALISGKIHVGIF